MSSPSKPLDEPVDENGNVINVTERGLLLTMSSSLKRIKVEDLARFACLSRPVREQALAYLRMMVQSLQLRTVTEERIILQLYDSSGREVYRKFADYPSILRVIKWMHRIGMEPRLLDLSQYSHEPLDEIMEFLHEFRSFSTVAMNESCSCPDDCLGLGRLLLKDIESISPNAFLVCRSSVNSLTVNAEFFETASDLLNEKFHFEHNSRELINLFKENIRLIARCLVVKNCNKTPIPRNTLRVLLETMRVDELDLLSGKEQHQLGMHIPIQLLRTGYTDLAFAKVSANDFWDNNESRMPLKKLRYCCGLDVTECSEVVEKLSAWFEVREMTVVFPALRKTERLTNDLTNLRMALLTYTGNAITIEFDSNTLTSDASFQQLCADIRFIFKDYNYVIVKEVFGKENVWLRLDLEHGENVEKRKKSVKINFCVPSA